MQHDERVCGEAGLLTLCAAEDGRCVSHGVVEMLAQPHPSIAGCVGCVGSASHLADGNRRVALEVGRGCWMTGPMVSGSDGTTMRSF